MPNWFYFTIEVDGTNEDVQEFVQNVKGSAKFDTEDREFDFNHFIPQPDNIFRENIGSDKKEELDAQGVPNWYDWNNANWGTKWNASCDDVIDDINGGMYSYNLRTAWSDPRPVLERMIEMYPHLNFLITGEEESNAYGIYINSAENVFLEEEPQSIDPDTGDAVYWDATTDVWRYDKDNSEVPDSENLWPEHKYSWS
jgi:hypothetical protein